MSLRTPTHRCVGPHMLGFVPHPNLRELVTARLHRLSAFLSLSVALAWAGCVFAQAPALLLAETCQGKVDVARYWVSEKLDGVRAYWDGNRLGMRHGTAIRMEKGQARRLVEDKAWLPNSHCPHASPPAAIRPMTASRTSWHFCTARQPATDANRVALAVNNLPGRA